MDGKPDVFWRKADGTAMEDEDWGNPALKFLGVEMRMARGTPAYEPRLGAIYLLFNAGEKTRAALPEALPGHRWHRVIDTSGQTAKAPRHGIVTIAGNSVVAFELQAFTSETPKETGTQKRKATA